MKRLMSFDPLHSISTYHDYDAATDETRIIVEGDAEPLLDQNKRYANDTEMTRQGIKDEFWLYASIPAILQHKWLVEEGLDVYNPAHNARLSRKLEDPEFKYLKTTTGYHKLT